MKNVKSIVSFAVFVVFSMHLFAQENTIAFSYDASGNLVERKVQVMIGGRIGNFNAPKDSLQLDFKVFPNPTNQSINIEGELPEGTTSGELFLRTVNGQIVKRDIYKGQAKTIPVLGLNPGLYLLEIWYSKELKSNYKIIISN
jgi:hypothetical protein